MYLISAAISGFLFGLGLFVAQMTDPGKIIAFLDVGRLWNATSEGAWDPSLIFVMAGGFLVMAIAHLIRKSQAKPVLSDAFFVSTNKTIDRPLLLGSAAFGVGWGLAGYCPGPAIASLAFMPQNALVFIVGLVAGSWAVGFWTKTKAA